MYQIFQLMLAQCFIFEISRPAGILSVGNFCEYILSRNMLLNWNSNMVNLQIFGVTLLLFD